MLNRNLLSAAIVGLISASGCASSTKAPEEAEMKSLNEAKIVDAPMAAEKGECHGINACKGKGECGGPGYSCAGNNACKGKGWVSMLEADCIAKKGKFKK
jgi:hypothetical protein